MKKIKVIRTVINAYTLIVLGIGTRHIIYSAGGRVCIIILMLGLLANFILSEATKQNNDIRN